MKGTFTSPSFTFYTTFNPNFSTCVPDLDYNQYECRQNYIKERMQREAKCLLPFQIYNKIILGKNICVNMTDFEGKCVMFVGRV